MFETRGSDPDGGMPERGLALIAAGIDALLDPDQCDLSGLDDRALLRHLAALETQARRLPAVTHQVVALLEERKVARRRGLRDTAALLRRELHVSAGEAKARVQAAGALAGESYAQSQADAEGPGGADAQDPVQGPAGRTPLPMAAAAQREGQLSPAHLRVIQDAIEELPIALRATQAAELEAILVAEARDLDPYRLAGRARQLLAELDPDRIRQHDHEHQRRRSATLTRNPDGSADLHAHLTPAGTAIIEAAILPLSAPQPDHGGGPDQREPRQRLHDGLLEGCRRLLVAQDVPGENGVPTTIIATIPLADLKNGHGTAPTGMARTQYGTQLSIAELLKLADQATLIPLVHDARGAPLHVGRARRFATPAQTYALIARDKGCSFPDCDHPPPWTQRHHIQAWNNGGGTDIDNLTLLCPHHHANFAALGWQCRIIDRIPHWIPPAHIDPTQTPIRNTRHDSFATGPPQEPNRRAA